MMISSRQLDYGVAMGALHGHPESGDQYLVKEFPNAVLMAVADGLGHGDEAAYAAKKAIESLMLSESESLIELMNVCHDALKETRGATITMALIHNEYQVSCLGVGNVAAIHWHKKAGDQPTIEELFSQGGVVGLRLPHLRVSEFTAGPGDTLILATDGILAQFTRLSPMCHALPQTIAEHIFKEFRNPKDDALVLVMRWLNSDKGR